MHDEIRVVYPSEIREQWDYQAKYAPDHNSKRLLLEAYEIAEGMQNGDIDYADVKRYMRQLLLMIMCYQADTLEQAVTWLHDLENEELLD